MSPRAVVIDGRTVDLDRFEPRVGRCLKLDKNHRWKCLCSFAQELKTNPKDPKSKERNEERFRCRLFNLDMSTSLGKSQAVCSRKTVTPSFTVTLSKAQVTQERMQNIGWE